VTCSIPNCPNPPFITITAPPSAPHRLCRACYDEICAFTERVRTAVIQPTSSTLTETDHGTA
jgi:hypothetical protein